MAPRVFRGWSANHVYDATGQRTRSVVTSGSLQTTTTWAYEGIRLTGLDAVRSDTATWSLEYLYDEKGTITGGIYSAEDTSSAFLVVATDRGDVRELLDSNGDAFAFYSYDAYGNPDETLSRQTGKVPAGLAADIASRNVLRYAGYCYDEVSGLYYLSQRYYDPASASFVSKDPARADGEESAYQYCAGDPVGSVDPSGLHNRATWPYKHNHWAMRLISSYFGAINAYIAVGRLSTWYGYYKSQPNSNALWWTKCTKYRVHYGWNRYKRELTHYGVSAGATLIKGAAGIVLGAATAVTTVKISDYERVDGKHYRYYKGTFVYQVPLHR